MPVARSDTPNNGLSRQVRRKPKRPALSIYEFTSREKTEPCWVFCPGSVIFLGGEKDEVKSLSCRVTGWIVAPSL